MIPTRSEIATEASLSNLLRNFFTHGCHICPDIFLLLMTFSRKKQNKTKQNKTKQKVDQRKEI